MQHSRLLAGEQWSFRRMRSDEVGWWKTVCLVVPMVTLLVLVTPALPLWPRLLLAILALSGLMAALFAWENSETGRALADAFASGPMDDDDLSVESAWASPTPYRLGDLVFYNSPRWHRELFPGSLGAVFEDATEQLPSSSGDTQTRLDILSQQLDAPLIPGVLALHLRIGDASQMPLRAALTGRGAPLRKRVWRLVPHGQPQPNAGPASLREILELVSVFHFSTSVVVVCGSHFTLADSSETRGYLASVVAMLRHRFRTVTLRTAQTPDDDLVFCVSAEHCAVGIGRFAQLISEMRRRRDRPTAVMDP